MKNLSLTRVIVRRIADDWKLLLTVFIGIVIATTIGAGTPIYLESLDQLSFNAALDRIDEPEINVFGAEVVATEKSIDHAERVVTDAIEEHIADVYDGHERFIKSRVAIVGTPDIPLAEGTGEGIYVSRGYLQHLSNLPEHVRFVEGQMASNTIDRSTFGVLIEAVVSSEMAERFKLELDHEIILSTDLLSQRSASTGAGEAQDDSELAEILDSTPAPIPAGPPGIVVIIVGIFEPLDPEARTWGPDGEALNPQVIESPTPYLTVQKPDEPPLALFADETAMRFALQDLVEETTFLGQETYIKGVPMLVDTPNDHLPVSTGQGILARLGFLVSLSNIEDHIVFDQGGMAATDITQGPRGPIVEAIFLKGVSQRTQTEIGDEFHFSPELGQREIITVRIVGFFDEDDKASSYWRSTGALLSLDPQRQDTPFLLLSDDSLSTIPIIVAPEVMTRLLSQTYPGAVVKPQWVVKIDPEKLKQWSAAEAREQFSAFSDAITAELPDADPTTEFVENLTESGQLRNFYAKIPMLLLLTVILLTVLFFLGILVSYLTQSREGDSSLLKTLGATLAQLTRIYTIEGLVMVAIAVIVTPFLAYGMVSVSGVLPFFEEMNSGNLMPIRLSATPFIISLAVGLLCLVIFVVPNVLSAQGGVLLRRLQTSRPLGLPIIQRFNLDIGFLIFGGPDLLGTPEARAVRLQWLLRGDRGERSPPGRARSLPHRRGACIYAVLPHDRAVYQRRVEPHPRSSGPGIGHRGRRRSLLARTCRRDLRLALAGRCGGRGPHRILVYETVLEQPKAPLRRSGHSGPACRSFRRVAAPCLRGPPDRSDVGANCLRTRPVDLHRVYRAQPCNAGLAGNRTAAHVAQSAAIHLDDPAPRTGDRARHTGDHRWRHSRAKSDRTRSLRGRGRSSRHGVLARAGWRKRCIQKIAGA